MTKTFRKLFMMTVFAAAVFALPRASYAFSSEAQQMCTGDAFRLCSSEIPNVSRITACMMKQRAKLSVGYSICGFVLVARQLFYGSSQCCIEAGQMAFADSVPQAVIQRFPNLSRLHQDSLALAR